MALTTRSFSAFVLIASAIVLGSALASQYWGGLVPCELCLLQRWPWRVAIAISLVALLVGNRPSLPWVALVLAIVFAVSIAFAFYHVGVEQKWFAGPSACTSSGAAAMTLEELERQLHDTTVVMCDKIQWSLFGISMAGWNMLASLVMTVICAVVFVRTRPAHRALAA